MEYGTNVSKIIGKLHKTGKFVKPTRISKRMKYRDDSGQEWVKILKVWWRFPQEIEY